MSAIGYLTDKPHTKYRKDVSEIHFLTQSVEVTLFILLLETKNKVNDTIKKNAVSAHKAIVTDAPKETAI